MTTFNVTYETWTVPDLEAGDTDKRGFVSEGVSLRDALSDMDNILGLRGFWHVEASSLPIQAGSWITVYVGQNCFEERMTNLGLHSNKPLTASTIKRIIKLIND